MKVYIDFSPTHKYRPGECSECPSPILTEDEFSSFTPSSIPVFPFQSQLLQQTTSLYTQQCNEAHWLVCHTTGSGQIAVLDHEAFHLLEQFKTPVNPVTIIQTQSNWSHIRVQEVIALFYALGFLNEEGKSSVNVKEEQPQTLTAWLHITNACNLRCNYCYIQKTQEHMQADTAYKAVDAIFRSALNNYIRTIHLKYAGGEASLHMRGVIALHDYAAQLAQQHGITLFATLLSNGLSLSDRAIENLQTRQIAIFISLDGIGAFHDRQRALPNGKGSFSYVQKTIHRLLEKGLVPSISVTVSHRNLPGLPELMRYFLKFELPFSLNYYREHTSVLPGQNLRFEDQEIIVGMHTAFQAIEESLPRYRLLDSLLDKAKTQAPHAHTCGVGRNHLVIDQRGGIAKCQAEIGRRVTTIEHADPLRAIREDPEGVQNVKVDEKEGCRSCDWRYWCAGGCPLLTYQVTGRNDVRSPNCNIYKALFPAALRLEALRLLTYHTPLSFEKAK